MTPTSQFTPADRDAENAELSAHVVTFCSRKYTALQLVMFLHPDHTETCAMQNMIRTMVKEITRLRAEIAQLTLQLAAGPSESPTPTGTCTGDAGETARLRALPAAQPVGKSERNLNGAS